jgi:hypothetical protein
MEFDIVSISSLVAAIGVVVGVILTVQELRNLRKQRQTDLLVRLAPWLNMNCGEMQQAMVKIINIESKNYDDFVKKYGPLASEKPEQMAIMTIGNYCETIGTLVRKGLVDINLVYEFWGHNLLLYWEKVKTLAEGAIKQYDQPWYGENIQSQSNAEYLYNELKRIEQKSEKPK